ncbi:nitroreductase family protein [Herbivorax sp. ANBcel31]|uniref:nitroreductase family protein n=1 Tax=Herbivorax sp. ANBcel31 TaxID=3069754 RepID=UPI0027B3CA90|nr:nitroreductase family protein [Herbivorax sp. ANBcel31]MDQ2084947.1 nitroreductase family protein [Herbivorax sp. ANBcel31]
MNEVIENIKNRRSVRFYSNRKIEVDTIKKILDAGNYAPTGAGVQPWRFVVVTNDEIIKKLAQNAKPIYAAFMDNADEYFKNMRKEFDDALEDSICYSAPAIIFVIGKKMVSYEVDCPMVCQNMMLAARSLKIGSCWLGFATMAVDDNFKASVLKLEEDEVVFGPIAFGYPLKEFPQAPEKKEVIVDWV